MLIFLIISLFVSGVGNIANAIVSGGIEPLGYLLLLLVFLPTVLTVVGCALKLKENSVSQDGGDVGDNAAKLLKERYIKGEINRKTYLQMKKDAEID